MGYDILNKTFILICVLVKHDYSIQNVGNKYLGLN